MFLFKCWYDRKTHKTQQYDCGSREVTSSNYFVDQVILHVVVSAERKATTCSGQVTCRLVDIRSPYLPISFFSTKKQWLTCTPARKKADKMNCLSLLIKRWVTTNELTLRKLHTAKEVILNILMKIFISNSILWYKYIWPVLSG